MTDAAAGTFDFTPPPGVTGNVTFTYTVDDTGCPTGSTSAPATVTINVSGPVIWFVDPLAASNGNGELGSPFQALSGTAGTNNDVADVDSSGDRVFVYSGGTASGALALNSSEWLIGQAANPGVGFDSFFGITPPTGTIVRPVLNTGTTTLGGTITLATSAKVQGVAISTGGSTALTGSGGITGVSVTQTGLTTTTGTALSLNSVAGTVTLSDLDKNGAGTGISLTAVGADVTVPSGATIASTDTAGVHIDQGTGAFSYAGTISNSSGRTVEVTNRNAGTPGLVQFTGSVSSTAGTGVNLDNNDNGTVTFSGGLVLSTGANPAFTATNGGTVNVTGATNTLTTTTGTALNVAGTNIGASGLTFHSVSAGTGASGPASGIVLNGTGSSGGLTVTGGGNTSHGGDASGGTIQHTTARGIQLTNTDKVSLNDIKVDTTGNAGIGGSGVTDFSLTYSTVSNNGSNGTSLDSNVDFGTATGGAPTDDNVDGVVTITNNVLTNAHEHGIDIQNYSGTISNATISNNTLTSATSAASSSGSGIRLLGFGSAGGTSNITKATISNNAINYFPSGAGITAQYGNSAGTGGTWGTPNNVTNLITISGNTITGFSQAVPVNTNAVLATLTGNGQAHWKIDNNTASLVGGTYIGVTIRGVAPVAQADITNNNLTGMVSANAQTIAYAVDFLSLSTDHPTLSGTISNNTITSQDGEGIQALATSGSSGILNVSIVNNSMTAPNCSGCNRFGMTFNAGLSATVTGTPTVCAKVSGNTAAGSGVDTGIGFRKRTGTTLNIDSFPAPGTDPTAYLTGLNPLGGFVTNITSSTAGSCIAP